MAALSDLLLEHARSRPNSAAWIDTIGSVHWGELERLVGYAAAALQTRGVRAGSLVVTHLENGLPAVVAALAIDWLGAVESPLDFRAPAGVVRQAIAALQAVSCLDRDNWTPDVMRWRERLATDEGPTASRRSVTVLPPAPARDDDLALVLWTSGTTSHSKGVMLSSRALLANAAGKLQAAPQTVDDRRLTILPLCHAYARTCDFLTWLLSGCRYSAGTGWHALEQLGPLVQPTVINAVPYLIDRLLDEAKLSPSSDERGLTRLGLAELRLLGCGGAALTPCQFAAIERLGVVPIQGYGLTESGPVICSATPNDARAGVVGRPIADTEVRLTPEGEIESRGPGVMMGYWHDPVATAQRITTTGWLRTGDLGVLESDGALRILGRRDDLIVLTSGRKVSPQPLESWLRMNGFPCPLVIYGDGHQLAAVFDPTDCGREPTGWEHRLALSARLVELFGMLQRQQGLPALGLVEPAATAWSYESGELTLKGTTRRAVILERLSSRAE